MKIGFDITPLGDGNKGRGVGNYVVNLLNSLKAADKHEIIEFNRTSMKFDVDLIHYPYFDLFKNTLAIFRTKPTVVTIHDVTPLVFSKHYPSGIKGRINLKLQKIALKSVSAVITDSEASKKDINKYLTYPEDKIHVVYLASSGDFKKIDDSKKLSEVKSRFNLPDKFALYVGNVNWNKNILNLTEAALESDIDIVLVGKGFKSSDLDHPELRSLREFNQMFADNPKVHILDQLNKTEDLVCVYNLASMTLFPSYYEGFGLPILESQSCGTPVITSNISSMPEVAGDSAILVNPNSVEEISHAINMILNDKEQRAKLVKEGYENIKRFSWSKAAQETIKVYEKVFKPKS